MSCAQALLILSIYVGINAVPPDACFAKFRWDDCGRPPVRVLYYWKPGSRCEVGVWRGCLPNLNMFHDEYECVATCIFTTRAESADYHALAGLEKLDNETLSDTEKIHDNETLSNTEKIDYEEAVTTPKSEDADTSTGKDDVTNDENETTSEKTPKINESSSSTKATTSSTKTKSSPSRPDSLNQK